MLNNVSASAATLGIRPTAAKARSSTLRVTLGCAGMTSGSSARSASETAACLFCRLFRRTRNRRCRNSGWRRKPGIRSCSSSNTTPKSSVLASIRDAIIRLWPVMKRNTTFGKAARHASMNGPEMKAASVDVIPRLTAPSVSPPVDRTFAGQLLHQLKDRCCFAIECLAGRCRAYAAHAAMKQGDAQFLLEFGNLLAQRRLGDMDRGRSTREAAGLHYPHEIPQVA